MKASFLISAPAYLRLGPAAFDRGWRSDPDYALRTVERVLAGNCVAARTRTAEAHELDVEAAARLAAMRGEFQTSSLDEIVRAIARFFGERPPRLEVEGVEYAVGSTLGTLCPLPG